MLTKRLAVASLVLTLVSFFSSYAQDDRRETSSLLPVRIGGKWGYINKSGNIIVAPQFDEAFSFSSGLALVITNASVPHTGFITESGIGKAGEAKWGYIDKLGHFVMKLQFTRAGRFSEGLAAVEVGGKLEENVYKSGKYGYIDKTGEFVIQPQFASARPFSEGLAKVLVGEQWGYVDKTGRMVIKPELAEVTLDRGDCESFSEGLACFESGGKVGYIDKTGKVVIQPQYDLAASFLDGLAAVAIGRYSTDNADSHFRRLGDKWGYIDKTGKYIWQPSK